MSAYMGSETIFFDEDSWSYDSVKLTIDGYVSYLEELAEEDGFTEWGNIFKMFEKYDTEENLYCWFLCYDDLSWVRFEENEE